jgi:pseudaminic acid synthase
MKIVINGQVIDENTKPYFIAEMSGNHNNDINRAKELIWHAKRAGASAVKLQTYTADSITLNSKNKEFYIDDGPWKGQYLYDLYETASTPLEWHESLFSYAQEIGITIFSSPFDNDAVDLLEGLDAPAYKIASPEIVDIGLIEYVASKNKPIIISTGMASLEEIEDAVLACKKMNNNQIILLHCTSSYPTPLDQANLLNMKIIKEKFNTFVGLSDHTIGNKLPIMAYMNGAVVIEKHFTLKRSDGGVDSAFSLEADELKNLIISLNEAHLIMGKGQFGPKDIESASFKHRRSLYFINDIKKGSLIRSNDIKSVRPSNGLKPKFLHDVIGKVANVNIAKNSPVKFELLEDAPK